MKEFINEELTKYISEEHYPWHMPGHKRRDVMEQSNENDMWYRLYSHDFTEARGLDDMHEPELFIKDSLEEIKSIYKSEASFMLVNGATGGILAALYACCPEQSVVIMARNCHKSVYNGISLLKLKPEYVVPDMIDGTDILGDVKPYMIKEKLEQLLNQGIHPSAVIITSPTYEGVISDVRGIKQLLQPYDIPLIVDEAHGAHLIFMGEGYPEAAVSRGADIVIESTHKTLPAMTQTALLHVMNSRLVPLVKKYLQVFQTSSPSYIFMQSIERALAWSNSNKNEFLEYRKRLQRFRKKCEALQNITLLNPGDTCYAYDVCKLVFIIKKGTVLKNDDIYTAGVVTKDKNLYFNGAMLEELLAKKYNQTLEMCSTSYVIAMTSVADSEEAYDSLYTAMLQIDGMLAGTGGNEYKAEKREFHLPVRKLLPGEAWNKTSGLIDIDSSAGHISSGYIYAYPPGISVIVPGEVMDDIVIADIKNMLKCKLKVVGVKTTEDKVLISGI